MELYYCAAGNRRFAEIAIAAGFSYGAQMPGTVYFPPRMIDQDWKNPNRARYMAALAEHRPYMASVLDWERQEQLPEVLSWAEEAAPYVEVVMIIPKVQGGIKQIPRKIGDRPVRLGYSVPTKFGGTELPAWEFTGRDIHLLGGKPHAQLAIYSQLRPIANVLSADGNYFGMKARRFCEHWEAPNHWIPDAGKTADGAHYAAFARSCENIMRAWRKLA